MASCAQRSSVGWLNDREKAIAVDRIKENFQGIGNYSWQWYQVREAFQDPRTYIYFVFSLCENIPNGGIGTFGSLIIRSFGFGSRLSLLMYLPLGAIDMISKLVIMNLSDRYNDRTTFVLDTSMTQTWVYDAWSNLFFYPNAVECVLHPTIDRLIDQKVDLPSARFQDAMWKLRRAQLPLFATKTAPLLTVCLKSLEMQDEWPELEPGKRVTVFREVHVFDDDGPDGMFSGEDDTHADSKRVHAETVTNGEEDWDVVDTSEAVAGSVAGKKHRSKECTFSFLDLCSISLFSFRMSHDDMSLNVTQARSPMSVIRVWAALDRAR